MGSKNLFRKIGLVVGAVLLFLLLLNFVLQISGFKFDIESEEWEYNLLQIDGLSDDPVLNHELRKNFVYDEEVLSKTNSIGLRDKEYPLNKSNNTIRIIIIGDSVTYGWDVEEEFVYSTVLEDLLNNDSNVTYEVWNAGVPGYDLPEIVVYLRKLMKYEPDLVVYGLYQNDLPGNPSFTFNKEDFYDTSPMIKFFDGTDISNLKLYQFIKKKIYFYHKNRVYKQYELKTNLILQQVSEHPLADIKNITSNNLIVLNIPNLVKEIPYDAPITLELAQVPDLKVIPILEEYEKLGSDWDSILKIHERDLAHPTKEGHALIANRLYEDIKNMDLYDK